MRSLRYEDVNSYHLKVKRKMILSVPYPWTENQVAVVDRPLGTATGVPPLSSSCPSLMLAKQATTQQEL
jgi:hypothetical protein